VGREPQVNMNELSKSKEELTAHFIEEVKVKKRIHELEQKMESATMSLMSKRNELQTVSKDKGKESVQVKVIQDEIDETNGQMRELKTQLDNNTTKMISLVKKRDGFNSEWR
jgi:chromosome segregation ATPase